MLCTALSLRSVQEELIYFCTLTRGKKEKIAFAEHGHALFPAVANTTKNNATLGKRPWGGARRADCGYFFAGAIDIIWFSLVSSTQFISPGAFQGWSRLRESGSRTATSKIYVRGFRKSLLSAPRGAWSQSLLWASKYSLGAQWLG